MTLNELADRMLQAATEFQRCLRGANASRLGRVREAVEKCARALPAARWVPEITCVACLRERRCWFGTGVACGRLEPLCSRSCVDYWLTHMWPGNVVYVGHGREWQDELPARRRAA